MICEYTQFTKTPHFSPNAAVKRFLASPPGRASKVTALFTASQKSRRSAGADLNVQFKDGKNIFHHILSLPVFFEDDEIVEIMMQKGGNVNQRDHLGRTPLHYATTQDYIPGLNRRIDHYVKTGKADLNSRDDLGNTPLHTLLINKDRNSIDDLIRHGADPTIKNNEGKTAEDLMREFDVHDKYSGILAEYHAAPPETRMIEHKWTPVEVVAADTDFKPLQLEIFGSLLFPKKDNEPADSLFAAGKNRLIGRNLHDMYTCVDSITGEIMWEEKSYEGHEYAFYSVQDDVIYSGHGHKEVAAVDPQTGKICWTTYIAFSYDTFESPFTEYKNLLVFHSAKSVYGVNKDTHKVQWKVKLSGKLGRNKCNVWNNYFIVQSSERNIPSFFLINMDTGLVDHTYKAEKGYKDHSAGHVAGDKLWYLSEEGSICRLNLATGEQEDVVLTTKYEHNPKSVSVSAFNYVNGKFWFELYLIHHDGEEDGLYSCTEDMVIERVASSSPGGWLFSKFTLHGSTLYFTMPGKIMSLSLDDFTEKELVMPTFSGMDALDSNICINNGTLFITQSGGNENEDRQILWQIK